MAPEKVKVVVKQAVRGCFLSLVAVGNQGRKQKESRVRQEQSVSGCERLTDLLDAVALSLPSLNRPFTCLGSKGKLGR